MKEVTYTHFGLLIAYVLPGFVVIWGLSGLWPIAPICTGNLKDCTTIPSLVGFFNTTLGAITAGMVVNSLRFALIDTIHHRTGLVRPPLDGPSLQRNLAAVNVVVDHHYRHYQFHSNIIVAGLIAYAAHLYQSFTFTGLPELLLVVLAVIFWVGSRDNLRKYYGNLETLTTRDKDRNMTNGMGKHKAEPATSKTSNQTTKKDTPKKAKPESDDKSTAKN